MKEQLIALLLNAGGVTANVPADNIEWGDISQGVKPPCIVLQRISEDRDYHMTGASGYVVSRVQIDIWSGDFKITAHAARAVSATLSGYRSDIFQGIFIDSERDFSALDAGDVNRVFRTSIDVIVHHTA